MMRFFASLRMTTWGGNDNVGWVHGQTLKLSRVFASLFEALRRSGEAKTEVIPRRHKMPPYYAQSLATIKSPDNPLC